jgi:hypothetical protein
MTLPSTVKAPFVAAVVQVPRSKRVRPAEALNVVEESELPVGMEGLRTELAAR